MSDFKLTLTSIDDCHNRLKKLFIGNASGKFRVKIVKWVNGRSLSISAQQHLFYTQIAKWHGDRSSLSVKNECKDMFGLPIILSSQTHGDQMEFVLNRLGYYNYNHENKMKLIQCLTVTSDFTVSESKAYTDQMIYYYNDIGIPIQYRDK